MNELNERIFRIRKALKLSQPEFGRNLGVSRDVIKNIEREDGRAVEPKMLFLEHLCEVYKVNPDYLLNGEGEMFFDSVEDEEEDELESFFNSVQENKKPVVCKDIIRVLSRLKDGEWELLGSILDAYVELRNQRKKDDQ